MKNEDSCIIIDGHITDYIIDNYCISNHFKAIATFIIIIL